MSHATLEREKAQEHVTRWVVGALARTGWEADIADVSNGLGDQGRPARPDPNHGLTIGTTFR